MAGISFTQIPFRDLEGFEIKDSGQRQEFAGGMVRDTTEGKVNFLNVRIGPMLRRWAEHLTKGRQKYPDPEPGVPNWTLAEGVEEFLRAKESAARHFEQWLAGDRDEDHAAAVFFNINLAEYVLDKAYNHGAEIDPGAGSVSPSLYADPEPLYDWEDIKAALNDALDNAKPWQIIGEADGTLIARPSTADGAFELVGTA